MPVTTARLAQHHAELGDAFYDVVAPAAFPQTILRFRNQLWAERIGLGDLTDGEWIAHFGRFIPLPGSFPQPLALRYHGHQFRSYNPDLGDGRGFLFAQAYDLGDGRLLDLATKGSGPTPWSRTADGRLTLKGGVREILATAQLEALGVNTSKTFSLIETGEALERGDEPSPTRSAVLVRLSHSHIRIGSFQRFLALDEPDNIHALMDHTIRLHMPEAWRAETPDRAVAFLEDVCRRVARTGAQWMAAGFVHGVLNTDNINVTGESFDYGPWRFAPVNDPAFTAAYFDTQGLYSFGRQPEALFWNLSRLAECLMPLAPLERLEAALKQFGPNLQDGFAEAILARLGLAHTDEAATNRFVAAFWGFLARSGAPFERTFFDWYGGLASATRAASSPSASLYASDAFAPVRASLEAMTPRDASRLAHPYFADADPCTLLIEEVETLWAPIADRDDWSVLHAKLAAIDRMAEAYGTRVAPLDGPAA
ncbi:Protein adenylyltransferase SelO [Methylobacterium adhaesivum]|uniref:Protein nucleotidyltransferase YdiU n=1 Tax=Methylobacterium adhaesivum TaxID=333297 RepID=A0ABT8BG20_9HYPH|nr:YdiU family protein [Methylobacterium adhaesivum]MDN3590211.1 YdiU family protein [Methylobacterium adhaesivum]GJD31066.1 Protein adenylyltransferase SelO [Methylobacterium adhaesivum]